MEISLPALLGIGLGAMFFGYFFGLFEGRGQGNKKRMKEEALPADAGVPPGPSAPMAAASTEAPKPGEPDAAMLILARQGNGQPSLYLDGDRVDVSALSGENRKRLIELMLIMRPWVEGGPKAPAAEPRPTLTPKPPPPAPAPVPSLMDRLLVATGMQQRPAAAVPTTAPSPVTAEMSIVAQIDAVLQLRLAETPLESLGVRLVESPKGDVTVVVGRDRYGSVGEVPDPSVQAAIRAAIAEWEQKYAPG